MLIDTIELHISPRTQRTLLIGLLSKELEVCRVDVRPIGDELASLLTTELAAVATLAEREVQILAVETHPITYAFSKRFLNLALSILLIATCLLI